MKKHTKIALAFILAMILTVPFWANNIEDINTSDLLPKNVQNKLITEGESNRRCDALLKLINANTTSTEAFILVQNIGLTKDDLTKNKVCVRKSIPALVSTTLSKDNERENNNYLRAASITDALIEIAGGIDNLRVEQHLNPDGNWFKGSLLAYWFWLDSLPVSSEKEFYYLSYMIYKGASKQTQMNAYYKSGMTIEEFVNNYGSRKAKELIKMIEK